MPGQNGEYRDSEGDKEYLHGSRTHMSSGEEYSGDAKDKEYRIFGEHLTGAHKIKEHRGEPANHGDIHERVFIYSHIRIEDDVVVKIRRKHILKCALGGKIYENGQ